MTLEEVEALPDELYDEVIDRFQIETGGLEDDGGYELEEDYYGDDAGYYGEGSYEGDYADAGSHQAGGEGGFEQ